MQEYQESEAHPMMTPKQVEDNLEALRKQASDSPTSLAAKQALINGLEFEYAALRTELAAQEVQMNAVRYRAEQAEQQLADLQAKLAELEQNRHEWMKAASDRFDQLTEAQAIIRELMSHAPDLNNRIIGSQQRRIEELSNELMTAQARMRGLEGNICEHEWIAEAPDAYRSMQAIKVCRKCRLKP